MSWRNLKSSSVVLAGLLALALMSGVVADEQPSDPSTPIKSLQFQAAEIRSVLTFLADYGNVNVVVAPDVNGVVTIKLQHVLWRDAMEIIGRTYDLAIVDEETSGYIRVMRAGDYRDELTKEREHEANQRKLVDLQTKIIKVSNSVAQDMVETVKSLMTERGKVTADIHSNSLIIQEVPDHMQVVLDYVADLDLPSKQIKISAQLLEISSSNLEELGVSWLAQGNYTSESGRTYDQTGRVLADRVSDPAGDYNVTIVNHDWSVDALIEAIVESGKGKIVAHPEITTVENRQARIQMGQKVPVKQFDESGNVVIKFEEIGTILQVTPHITAENQILLYMKPERSTFEFEAAGVVINTNNAETNVIVNNGQTAVIGGLTTQDETETEIGVPLLKDIPLLGQLFKYTQKNTESRDLVIFVTPTIVEDDLAMNSGN